MGDKNKKIPTHLKYRLYEESVQAYESDIDFINQEFKRFRKRKPLSLKEDFGGTAILSCGWVQQSDKHSAKSIDLDSEPISYGENTHLKKLNTAERTRIEYIKGDVLHKQKGEFDVSVAFNFSYFIFKTKKELLKYFKIARSSLNKDGIFFVDIFGGADACQKFEEETDFGDHRYFWDCDNFDPITNEVLYYIHFEVNGRLYRKVFTYDWRMWTPAEVKEVMEEAGFKKVYIYWEGLTEDGEGDGNFVTTTSEEQCDSWICYIAGLV